jgi:hypothetical protein
VTQAIGGWLTFPSEVETFHAISALSPRGSALSGPGLGQTIDWIDAAGQDRRPIVVAILPSAAEAKKDTHRRSRRSLYHS